MNKWSRLYRDLRSLSVGQAGQLLARRASKGWRARKAGIFARRQIHGIEKDLGSALIPGQALHGFLDSKFTRLNGFPITPDRTRETAALLNQRFPDWVARCIGSANRICENRISLLGHEIHLEEPPAWHNDHISGAVWPTQHSGQLLNLRMNHGSDIKFVWELSRFHHGVTLARAFALTTDERFARKFLSLFNDWLKANPPYAGPNWTCAMEVAIRAVNLLWAGSLLVSSEAFDRRAREAFIKTLLVHGAFIYHNLEYDVRAVGRSLQPVNGNHYLADLSGLLYLSCAFPECRFASVWREFAQRELFREIRSQVDEEGVHWEYSPGYHRLVLEMILSCLILLERQSVTIPEDIREKASKMLDFIRHYTKPSGGVPLVRDIDNGRFCILGEEELSSHDHLLALGAIYFDRPDLYPGQLFEDCLWYLGPRACEWHKREPAPSPSPPRMECAGERGSSIPYRQASRTGPSASSKLYRQSGFCVMRHDSHYLLAVCSPKGMKGYCGHTHNDFLSFELEAFGRTFLTDCGSYVYSQSPEWRNRMRSTASHNTLMVDGIEQNHFNSSQLFEIDSRVRPEVKHWSSDTERDLLDASYTLALPDGSRVTHERRFVFLKNRGVWVIRDQVFGVGLHTVDTRFHFAEGIEIAAAGRGIYRTLCTPGPNLFLTALGDEPLSALIESGSVSRTYAAKTEIRVLHFAGSTQLPCERLYLLAPTLSDAGCEEWPLNELEGLRRLATQVVLQPS